MSIEKTFERIADALEKIADHLGGAPIGGNNEVAEPEKAEKPTADKKSAAKKSTAKKAATKNSSEDGPTIAEVRDALKEYQKAVGGGTAGRELLEEFGAGKLSDLDEGKYTAIMAEAGKRINAHQEESADDDDDDDGLG